MLKVQITRPSCSCLKTFLDLKREFANVFERIKRLINLRRARENVGKSLLKQNKYQRNEVEVSLSLSSSFFQSDARNKKKLGRQSRKKPAWENCNHVLIYARRLRVGFCSLFICDSSSLRDEERKWLKTKTLRKFVHKSKLKTVPSWNRSYRWKYVLYKLKSVQTKIRTNLHIVTNSTVTYCPYKGLGEA